MNWEAIGAIGEILGAAGVIGTLAYLAVQIRRNTNTIRAQAFHSVSVCREVIVILIAFCLCKRIEGGVVDLQYQNGSIDERQWESEKSDPNPRLPISFHQSLFFSVPRIMTITDFSDSH